MTNFLLGVLCVLLLTVSGFGKVSTNSTVRCIESEKQALLNFKKGLYDPNDQLASWTSGEEDCCKWSRVGCDHETDHVFMLDIGYNGSYPYSIAGEISSSLLDLPYLSHLNLNGDFKSIPKIIGSLHNLTYLAIKVKEFPYQLGNLSKLQFLWIYGPSIKGAYVRADSIRWLSRLSYLRTLSLERVEFGEDVDWLKAIKVHPSLSAFYATLCQFPKINSSSLSFVKPSKSLAVLSLDGNILDSYSWLFDLSTVLVDLRVSGNEGRASIPNSFGELEWLENLDLSESNLAGGIPTSFRKLCHLKTLDLSNTRLSEPVGSIFQKLSCSKKTLQVLRLAHNQLKELNSGDHFVFESLKGLDLSYNLFSESLGGTFLDNFPKLVFFNVSSNKFVGELHDFEKLSSLRQLHLRNNSFNGNLGESIAKLSNLSILDVSSNSLYGTISETNLSTLSKLQILDLSGNSFVFNVSANWIPPFQLHIIKLRSCKLGPSFPSWLKTQKDVSYLDISNSKISDTIPPWFWNFASALSDLNISFNQMSGQIPNLPLNFYIYQFSFDLSSNQFYGPIPQFLANTTALNLSRNNFSGNLSFLCSDNSLYFLDLSHNSLSGDLTDCWVHLQYLTILNIESNKLSGEIPASFGLLFSIRTLQLRNNSLTGPLPSSLASCTNLQLLDLGDNSFNGPLPAWIGES